MSGSQKFEEQIFDNLKYLVKKLTISGKDDLNPSLMKKLKHICKQSDTYVTKAYHIIMQQFEKKHAEIRFSCFAIFDQLFNRSHCFRCLVLNDFTKLIDLVLGPTGKKHDLKPLSVAIKLKKNAIIAIKMWHDKFGEAYKLLAIGVDYMINCKYVNFVSMTAMTPGERAQEEESQRLSKELELKRVTKLKVELAEVTPQIEADLIAFRNCFQLLIPNVENFFIPVSDEMAESNGAEFMPDSEDCDAKKVDVNNLLNSNELDTPTASDEDDSLQGGISDSEIYGSEYVRSSGILKATSIKIDLSALNTVEETKDNQFVVENLKELFVTLKKKWLLTIEKMQTLLLPYCENNADTVEKMTKIYTALESAVNSYSSISIIPYKEHYVKRASGSREAVDRACYSSDSEDDFIEVTDSDPRVAQALQSEAELLGLLERPSCSKLAKWNLDSNAGSSSSKGLAAQETGTNGVSKLNGTASSSSIPQTQLTLSMKKCSSDQKTPENFLGEWTPPVLYANPLAGLGQVWLSSSNSQLNDEEGAPRSTGGLLGLATTPVNIPTTFQPVRWQCRAPLPSGRLCPRRDRVKCPLHGRVLPRCSATGIPDLDYATAVLRRARLTACLAPEEECETEDDGLQSTNTTHGLQTGEEKNNSDEVVTKTEEGLDGVVGCQRLVDVESGFCLESPSEGEVVDEDSETVLDVVDSKKRSDRKKLCSKLNEESGAALNTGQETPPLSSTSAKHVQTKPAGITLNENVSIGSSKSTSNQTIPQSSSSAAPADDASNIKCASADDEVISVAAAARLVEAVKVARAADRRKRMNLDQDWQNPALLARLKAATGVDLDMRNVRKRQRDDDEGLTDLRKLDATPRKRLAKKVLCKKAMSRLNKALAKH